MIVSVRRKPWDFAGELQQGVGDALVGELGGQGVGLGRGDDQVVLAV